MLRGELHNAGADGKCEACGEPFPCPTRSAVFESVVGQADRDAGWGELMTNTATLEERFHQRLLDLYREIGEKSTAMGEDKRYWPHRFHQMVNRRGGLETAQWHLARRDPEPGFHRVVNLGLPELSLEATVLQRPWRTLFNPQELATARRRLQAERGHLRQIGQQMLAERLDQVLVRLEQ